MDQAGHVDPDPGVRGELVVALYGRSLMLEGVARRLARQANLRVVAIDGPSLASVAGRLASDVLIVDLEIVPVESALALLRVRSHLVLVGLEASGARLIVLSGEQARSVGTDDLVALLQRGPTHLGDGGMS